MQLALELLIRKNFFRRVLFAAQCKELQDPEICVRILGRVERFNYFQDESPKGTQIVVLDVRLIQVHVVEVDVNEVNELGLEDSLFVFKYVAFPFILFFCLVVEFQVLHYLCFEKGRHEDVEREVIHNQSFHNLHQEFCFGSVLGVVGPCRIQVGTLSNPQLHVDTDDLFWELVEHWPHDRYNLAPDRVLFLCDIRNEGSQHFIILAETLEVE